MKKLFDVDGDVVQTFHKDAHDDKKFYISQKQDITPYLAEAHRARSERGEHTSYKSEAFNKKASIPVTVAESWCNKHKIPYGEFLSNTKVLKRFLNDPDNKMFLHIPGKV